MNKQKLLVVGKDEKLRKRMIHAISRISGAVAIECEDFQNIDFYFKDRRINGVLLECKHDIAGAIFRIRTMDSDFPILVYGIEPSYELTREAFLAGARDVIDLKSKLEETLESALDFTGQGLEAASHHMAAGIETARRRGEQLEDMLANGTPPPFYMNGNRAVLLRADVIPLNDDVFWFQNVAWSWIREFGANAAFIFKSECGLLRIGAVVEMNFVNAASFRRMLSIKLESFFQKLHSMNCICVATYTSTDFLSVSLMRHMDALTRLVFYKDECVLLSEENVLSKTNIPAELYSNFCSAVSQGNLEMAKHCLSETVRHLREDMPDPDFARKTLNRLLLAALSLAENTANADVMLKIDTGLISRMQACMEDILEKAMAPANAVQELSSMDGLLLRIRRNPGQKYTVDSAAAEMNFSRSHFCRIFKEKAGMSFNAYVSRARIDFACDLLRKTSMPIAEVADAVGIASAWYFKSVFEKEMGVPLEEWLRNVRK